VRFFVSGYFDSIFHTIYVFTPWKLMADTCNQFKFTVWNPVKIVNSSSWTSTGCKCVSCAEFSELDQSKTV
jgi:hypothetical protein